MKPDVEARHVASARQELRQEFPQVPDQTIDAAVRAELEKYADARIRDYIPLFIKRAVRERLINGGPEPSCAELQALPSVTR